MPLNICQVSSAYQHTLHVAKHNLLLVAPSQLTFSWCDSFTWPGGPCSNTVWNCNIVSWHWLPLREGSVYLLAVPMSSKCGSHIHLELGRAVFAVNTVVSLLPTQLNMEISRKRQGRLGSIPLAQIACTWPGHTASCKAIRKTDLELSPPHQRKQATGTS